MWVKTLEANVANSNNNNVANNNNASNGNNDVQRRIKLKAREIETARALFIANVVDDRAVREFDLCAPRANDLGKLTWVLEIESEERQDQMRTQASVIDMAFDELEEWLFPAYQEAVLVFFQEEVVACNGHKSLRRLIGYCKSHRHEILQTFQAKKAEEAKEIESLLRAELERLAASRPKFQHGAPAAEKTAKTLRRERNAGATPAPSRRKLTPRQLEAKEGKAERVRANRARRLKKSRQLKAEAEATRVEEEQLAAERQAEAEAARAAKAAKREEARLQKRVAEHVTMLIGLLNDSLVDVESSSVAASIIDAAVQNLKSAARADKNLDLDSCVIQLVDDVEAELSQTDDEIAA